MPKKYSEKILKQLKHISISLFLIIFTFALYDSQEVLALIAFSVLIAIVIYKIVLIKVFIKELSELNINDESIEVKEKKLINCYKDIKLKEKDLNEPEEETLSNETIAKLGIVDDKKLLEDSFIYTMDNDLFKNNIDYKLDNEEVVVNDNNNDIPEDIKKYIRKLPEGRKASQRAIDLAKEYGYELKEGETFIKPKK